MPTPAEDELAKLEAQKKFFEAQKAAADAQKAAADAQKAVADAKKNTDLAAAQALIGTVAASGFDTKTDLKQDAGKCESMLLAADAISDGARDIIDAIKNADVPIQGQKFLLSQSTELDQFANYRQFLLQTELLNWTLEASKKEASRLEAEAEPQVTKESPVPPGIPAITMAGVALDAFKNLTSYFQSGYEVGSIAITSDVKQLGHALTSQLCEAGAVIVAPAFGTPTAGVVSAMIKPIADIMTAAAATAKKISDKALKCRKDAEAESDQAKKSKLISQAEKYDQAAAVLQKCVTACSEYVATLAVKDDKNVSLLTKVVRERMTSELLEKGAHSIALDIHGSGGSFYLKKNWWSSILGIPLYVSGAVVVGFSLTDKDGNLKASGAFPVHAGFQKIQKVADRFKRSGNR